MANQRAPYPLRLPEKLRALAQLLADLERMTLHAWLLGRLEDSVRSGEADHYLCEQWMLSERMGSFPKQVMTVQQSSYPLRLPDALRERLESFARENSRSMNSEIQLRIVAALTDEEFKKMPANGENFLHDSGSPLVLLHWASLNELLLNLKTRPLSELPRTLEDIERYRQAIDAQLSFVATDKLNMKE